MKIVLLSGGSGKRLWPLSNDSRSKQFLKLLTNSGQQAESMVQRIWRQLEKNGLAGDALLSTNESQVELIENQLGAQIPCIIEPQRRDTFPAIALASSYLHSVKSIAVDEVVIVMPVDPYVDDHFFEKVKELEQIIRQSAMDIALIGVKPDYPSTKYGYILPIAAENADESVQTYKRVKQFIEKPTEAIATQLITQQALWNCGVFAFRLGYMLQQLQARGLPAQYHELQRQYEKLPKISFDYEIVEKTERVAVVPYDGEWMDIGTWNTLTAVMEHNPLGKGYLHEDCDDTSVINELEIPVVVIGISHAIVAVSPDGILMADKAKSHLVKDIVSGIDTVPMSMYQEKRWGWVQVLSSGRTAPDQEVLTRQMLIRAGKHTSYHVHHQRKTIWIIVAGRGEIAMDDQLLQAGVGDVFQIPAGARHGIRAINDLKLIEIQMGENLAETDVERICTTWEEVRRLPEGNADVQEQG
ncbi:sugar phosphate nucleotidyltransferase [Brevibacillus migulae]|uniref:sugar phosphate nucleotidyltransferase n=1 Tax=Brevibacillus migulae TaxID=1644114 RepID=UPI00106E16C7|nr:sugar phosphate nucleotidyltransferase [Brevibacillus migulae]